MQTLLHRRTEKDIWQHLYEFPLVEGDSLFSVGANMPSVDLTHVLSHQRLHARFHIEKVDELPHITDTIVISLSDIDNYALSRLTLRALASIQLPL
jgi:A/G-specific adenine glycosylase